MKDTVFGWLPLVWAVRVVLFMLVCVLGYIGLLYFVRFLRPKHAWHLVKADLPVFRNVGATAKFLGQELSANATLETTQNEQIAGLDTRLRRAEDQIANLWDVAKLKRGGSDDRRGKGRSDR